MQVLRPIVKILPLPMIPISAVATNFISDSVCHDTVDAFSFPPFYGELERIIFLKKTPKKKKEKRKKEKKKK